jgi:hypothetical protein
MRTQRPLANITIASCEYLLDDAVFGGTVVSPRTLHNFGVCLQIREVRFKKGENYA